MQTIYRVKVQICAFSLQCKFMHSSVLIAIKVICFLISSSLAKLLTIAYWASTNFFIKLDFSLFGIFEKKSSTYIKYQCMISLQKRMHRKSSIDWYTKIRSQRREERLYWQELWKVIFVDLFWKLDKALVFLNNRLQNCGILKRNTSKNTWTRS